jgi:polar amino acid transport system substrate-binding protein
MRSRVGRGRHPGVVVAIWCSTGGTQVATTHSSDQPVLRVGRCPGAPARALRREGRVVGIEPDLCQALVDHFRRPLVLVAMDWESLIPALLDGRIDAIMSGMTVTPAREVRVAFSDPYMRSGLAAATRRGDLPKYKSRDAIVRASANVGVRGGSTPRAGRGNRPSPTSRPIRASRTPRASCRGAGST